ncbi:SP_1767 family glycosyltransferase [Pediococcus pentosaceus]|jgi:glycosyltransferase family protein|uniref:SP_1767 family glycosyltransferase n=1 Tax=Pediococcus pentosaceus TaxID=1255 RepID=UPI0021E6ECDD|nr:SP_1767 family glycosyltransferase [Pediococcus pentosaceus]MCV3325609.1 SP_1767 family glycosyltransferase [Pediococcus pentosaceus]
MMRIKSVLKNSFFYQALKKHTSLLLVIKHPIIKVKYEITKRKINIPNILSFEDTLEKLENENVSLGRFGDGELRWLLNLDIGYFQSESKELSKRLLEVIQSDEKNFLVGLPDVFNNVSSLNFDDGLAWESLVIKYGKEWSSKFLKEKKYVDANVTRPYIDRRDKTKSGYYFAKLKNVWKDKHIVIVEGEKTRFGVGNDLLSDAKTVRRILCPSINAFDKYQDILDECLDSYKENSDTIYLCALGPTATILSYDLFMNGIKAIDIGHVDIEYEWYLMRTETKVAIPNKYVNEVANGNEVVENLDDSKYNSEIVKKIGVCDEES